jgi:ATP/maltotriose-dependent transcriptional regulator MalT
LVSSHTLSGWAALSSSSLAGRSLLIEWLARGHAYPIVSLVVPPGHGKTTLLAHRAQLNGQAFAWVPVEEPDNDPKAPLTYGAPQSGPPSA